MSQESTEISSTSADTLGCGDVTTLARLTIHLKENNIAYLIGLLITYQMGLLDKVFTYGTGVCS